GRRGRAATSAAAAGGRRWERQLGAIEVPRIVAAMDDPDLILFVDAEPDRLSEDPVVRHRLGPEGIDLELRHHHLAVGLSDRLLLEQVLADAQHGQQDDQCRADHAIARQSHVSFPLHAKRMRWMSVLRRQYTLSRLPVKPFLRRLRRGARVVLAAALLVSLCTNVAAHEIPGDVAIQAWLKPEGQRLRLLVRVPLVAMRDMNYPTRGDKTLGILDLSRAESLLRDAATLWVGEAIDL